MKHKPVVTVDTHDAKEFEAECKSLYDQGYKLVSADVGFVQSEAYDFCPSFMAIFTLTAPAPGIALEALRRTRQTLNNLTVGFRMPDDVREMLGNELENIRAAIAQAEMKIGDK